MTNILDCGHAPSPHSASTTGYGTDKDGRKHCYDCCAQLDRQAMIKTGKAFLYTSKHNGMWFVGNWTSDLLFPVFSRVSTGKHNFAGTQTHFWFVGPDKHIWHGIQYGCDRYDGSKGLSNGYYCRAYRTKEIWKH